ncbi:hypothetical protein SBOR_0732 [Sclerotinia borealis F-4128]|uniref:Uncharacterized protein n=1 Tax=Sclerotinia borealis (strain F-4128) TaxID=1432307 RepID=W9CW74_SCLBF|nr:hypothetical protein SBOR_0732 [Sclerotinia borealis F-4128]
MLQSEPGRANILPYLLLICSAFATLAIQVLSNPIATIKVPRSNPLGIDWSPAPPPNNGPPLSAEASRNKALLPAQIGGIIGAYLFSLCIVGILIIALGRRLRRQVELEARALEVELVDSAFAGVYTGSSGPTPVSPANLRNFSWPSPDKKCFPAINPDPSAFVFPPIHESYTNPYVYPTQRHHSIHQSVYSHQSNPSIDNQVIEADREMMNRNLEDLYAHVMEQEEAKAAGMDVRSMPPPKVPGGISAAAPQQVQPPSKKFGKHKPSDINIGGTKSTKTHSRASSIISALTSPRSAPKSPGTPRKKGIRGLRISSPIATPHSTTFSHPASDEEPLTPRYMHRAPPRIPRYQAPYGSSSANGESPTRSIAETLETVSPVSPQQNLPSLNTRNLQVSLKSEMNTASPQSATEDRTKTTFSRSLRAAPSKLSLLHKLKPSNGSSASPDSPSSSTAIGSTSTAIGSTSTTNNQFTASAINPPTRSLPFREQFQQNMLSPTLPTTKTTVLERVPQNNGQKSGGGLRTGGLKTPFSGGTVPYSPYQPFTPMMPITPRLVTREDRKKMKKLVPRTPVVELIRSEEDIWDSGY